MRRSSEPIKAAQLQQRGQLGHIVNLRPRGSLPRSTRLHGTSGGVGRRRCSFWACTVRAAARLPSNGSAQTARRLFCWFSTDRRQGLVACHRGSNARSVRIRGRCTFFASLVVPNGLPGVPDAAKTYHGTLRLSVKPAVSVGSGHFLSWRLQGPLAPPLALDGRRTRVNPRLSAAAAPVPTRRSASCSPERQR